MDSFLSAPSRRRIRFAARLVQSTPPAPRARPAWCLALALAVALGVLAQPQLRAQANPPPSVVPSGIDAAAERAQRDQQDRNNAQFGKDRESAQPPSTLSVPAAPVQKISGSKAIRRHINELKLTGATLMRRHFRAQLEAEYRNRDLSIADLEQLLADITAYYVRRGYVTTRVYVAAQDISMGTLTIIVVEGRIHALGGEGWAGNLFPTHPGAILNLRDLEQGIDNLNRLSSRHATMNLVPGVDPGETDVVVADPLTKFWHASLSDDNTGTDNTGRNQASAGLILDSPLSLGDELSLNYRRSIPYRPGKEASDADTASYIVPWGYELFTAGASLSDYALAFNAPSGTPLPFKGDSRSLFVRTDRVIYRGQQDRLTLSGTLTWKASRNYLLGNLIGVTSRELTIWEVDLNYSTSWKGAVINATVGAAGGVPLFGGLSDASGLPQYAPRAEYVKETGSLSYYRGFQFEGIDLSINSSVSGQYSNRVLYGTEEMTIGSIYAVRGFDLTTLAGDSGYVWRNDLSLPLKFKGPWGGRFGPIIFRPYLGADLGEAWSSISGIPGYTGPSGTLAGVTIGGAIALGAFNSDLSYSKSVERPASLTYEPGHFYFRVNYTF